MQILVSTTDFIWQIFEQSSEADRKNVSLVSMFIDTMDGVAYADNGKIHVSADYIQEYSVDIKT